MPSLNTFFSPAFNRNLALLILAGFIFPVVILAGDSVMRIHDQLDSYNVFTVLANSGKVFERGDVQIDNIMNGLPRSCFPSGYNFVIWLIMLFGEENGFFINYFFVHLIGFVGAFLFLRNYVNKNDTLGYNWLVAACYSVLPVSTLAGISLMGIPLVLFAFLNLFEKRNPIASFLILIFFALYSSLIHTGVFVLMAMGLIFVYKVYKKQAPLMAFMGLILLCGSYAFVEQGLIRSILFSTDYVSHRKDFIPTVMLNIKGVIGVGMLNAVKGNYASANYPGHLIVCFALLGIVMARIKRVSSRELTYLLGVLFFIGVFVSFWDWTALKQFYYSTKVFLAFNPRRLHFFLPVVAIIILAVTIRVLMEANPRMKYLILPVILVVVAFIYKLNKEFNDEGITFNQFFSKPLLKEIDGYIGKPKESYRIAHIGFEPTISQCYGFYTLDSYQNNYPLDYKMKFRKIIEKELEKDPVKKNYFDVWGNRCFLMASESIENNTRVINQLDIDTNVFKQMGGKYIFSDAIIKNAGKIGLKFLKVFTHPSSTYAIHLYEAV
jgi:hypothetical protein